MSAAIVDSSASQGSISVSPRWIISKRDDLVWFIGSAFAGYIALALVSGVDYRPSPTVLTFVWSILISGPHFYATATRTYLDAEQRHKLGGFLWLIVPLAFVPVLILSIGGDRLLYVFGGGWGSFHVAKQHMGIMMLYKRKNNERNKTDFFLDKWFLLTSQVLPLALFLLWYLSSPALGRLFSAALTIQILLVVGYTYRQILKYRNGEEMNWPKLMLLTLIIPLHWLAFVCASKNPIAGIFIFTIVVNIGHSLQYHRLTWFHNRNRYQDKPGLSGLINRNVVRYYGTTLCLYLFARLVAPSFLGGYDWLLSAPVFMHYLLDWKIWRVREDPELARALRLV